MAGKARRTTHRSKTGKKLYAVRDAKGRFKDIQTYKKAHGQDIKRQAKGEAQAQAVRRAVKRVVIRRAVKRAVIRRALAQGGPHDWGGGRPR
jgi:hypothetical protein